MARLAEAVIYPNEAFQAEQGMGMTSQRTRNRLIERLWQNGVKDEAVLNAMRVTPRHVFIDEALASRAYEDTALPIGFGQTISQPWVVAQMTAWLRSGQAVKRVLEVGTGSGYQAAILGLLVDEVYTVERIEPLMLRARRVLQHLQLKNVEVALSDGHWGWPEKAPFDAILCAASPRTVPEALLAQLVDGGRLVMPVGGARQRLCGFVKTGDKVTETDLGEVLFVPMLTGLESD